MKLYEVEISAKVTVDICEFFPVKATSKEEAVEKAKIEFAEYIASKFDMIYDCKDVESGYVGVIRHEMRERF